MPRTWNENEISRLVYRLKAMKGPEGQLSTAVPQVIGMGWERLKKNSGSSKHSFVEEPVMHNIFYVSNLCKPS